MQAKWGAVKGLMEALGDGHVVSNSERAGRRAGVGSGAAEGGTGGEGRGGKRLLALSAALPPTRGPGRSRPRASTPPLTQRPPHAPASPDTRLAVSYRTAPMTHRAVSALKAGEALFTMPKGVIKCPGAGHKVGARASRAPPCRRLQWRAFQAPPCPGPCCLALTPLNPSRAVTPGVLHLGGRVPARRHAQGHQRDARDGGRPHLRHPEVRGDDPGPRARPRHQREAQHQPR
jgi:hypothetical protein